MKYPKVLGPYSVCKVCGDFIFLSGQLPINPETNDFVKGDIKEQTRQCFKNLNAVLSEQNCSLENIVKVSVFLKNMDDFIAVNEAYSEFFSASYPARSAVEVSRLPKDANIEIEAIAYKNN